MSNNQVTLFQQETTAALDPRFAPLVKAGVGADLGDGIRGSYGIVGIKAGKFRLKYQGQEQVLMQADGISPVAYIDVVIVKANPFLNKQYFEGKYAEGSTAPPVCYSLDGVKPSDASTQKQATSCALCPKNQFGSLIGENGVKQKACRDTKKLAVVPLADIRNATMGGAMLFRVPPSSLKGLSVMADQLKGRGYPYNSVAVRIAFDQQASHPKPTFTALRPLQGEEVDAVLEMFQSDSVARVLADNDIVVEHGEEAAAPQGAPVQPAGMPRPAVRNVSAMPTAEETAPVPQAAAKLVDVASIQEQLAATQAVPRTIRVQPDAPPPPEPVVTAPAPIPAATNPFAQPVKAAASAAAPAPQPEAAAANPFAPPPTTKAAARRAAAPAPVTIDVQPTEQADAPPENTQLGQDISAILAGLNMST